MDLLIIDVSLLAAHAIVCGTLARIVASAEPKI